VRTIGLIGGMSWESSLEYYRLINLGVQDRLGGLHSARCLMYSLNFEEIERYQHQGRWDLATGLLVDAARRLEAGGAECIVICTNTMHRVAPQVAESVAIPLLHIADATAQRIRQQGLHTVGLLGTIYTMEQDFYRGRLEADFGLEILVPDKSGRELVNRVIYDELVLGTVNTESRKAYCREMDRLVARGAQGIILGCTEIGMLVKAEDTAVPQFDTTLIHAQTAVEFALAEHPLG
jgi:aspartate racemase